ncbi:peptidyl-tRNA hydrolase [Plectosphaerella plurivora]|uniref:peptidyl-tRNA hydrolase n=1 Tax=Plectosphaerella plurivora TaxID=936078 RepID=A0A9P9A6L1_9PEZI|nr:peptidyl-tRNA hydrolase [Plectosphaerella plurivora]
MAHPRVLILSLGNPAPYLNTLHSAGHHALAALQPLLGPSQTPFTSHRIESKATLASFGPRYILYQSPSVMNVSGRWVQRAYRDLANSMAQEAEALGLPAPPLHLLLVHDDLEEELGVVKVRKWTSSHRGHNGVKSVNASMKPATGARFARISIGIGRPAERSHDTVSDYVLRDMTRHQQTTLKEVGHGVLKCLEEWTAQTQALEAAAAKP